jgi:hypothetical protein
MGFSMFRFSILKNTVNAEAKETFNKCDLLAEGEKIFEHRTYRNIAHPDSSNRSGESKAYFALK